MGMLNAVTDKLQKLIASAILFVLTIFELLVGW
jgi:hypothetical protein